MGAGGGRCANARRGGLKKQERGQPRVLPAPRWGSRCSPPPRCLSPLSPRPFARGQSPSGRGEVAENLPRPQGKTSPGRGVGAGRTPPRPLPGSCPRLGGQQEQSFLPLPLFLVSLREGPPPHYLFGGGSPLTPPSSCPPQPSTTMQLFIRAQSLHTVEVSSAETVAQLKVSPQDTRLCPSPQ